MCTHSCMPRYMTHLRCDVEVPSSHVHLIPVTLPVSQNPLVAHAWLPCELHVCQQASVPLP